MPSWEAKQTEHIRAALKRSSSCTVELMPAADALTRSYGFEDFEGVHDTITLVIIVFVAYLWSSSFAAVLIVFFLTAHLPLFYMTFPSNIVEDARIVLESAIGLAYFSIITKRDLALSKAEAAADRSAHLASHDPLTDLPNRSLFQLEVRQTLAVSQGNGSRFAVIFVDLDDFKDINDSLGHDAGDECLIMTAERLRRSVREGDIVARLDGTEHAALLATRVVDNVAEPIVMRGHALSINLSIGIAVYPEIARNEVVADSMQLLAYADMAMYKAKNSGRSSFEFYDREMSVEASDKISMLSDLRGAIEKNQLFLLYQPIFDPSTNKPIGAEALLRWRPPERGVLLPESFVPIGRWVTDEACAQNRYWQDSGLPPIKVSVNLSPAQLRSPGVPDLVAGALQ